MLKEDKTKKREERHAITQEDFTPDEIVNSMLSNLPQEAFTHFEKKILDTSCGIGNFLVTILKKRLEYCKTERDALEAVKGIYGVELMADNVLECRERLYKEIINKFPIIVEYEKLNYDVRAVIKNRIQWYDSLKFDYDNWPKLRTMGRRDKTINFRELQRKEHTKYPMWYEEEIKDSMEPSLFDGFDWWK